MSLQDLDEGLTSVGSSNFYQNLICLGFLFLKISSASYVTSLPFYLKEPSYKCYNETEDTYSVNCTYNEVCLKKYNLSLQNLNKTTTNSTVNNSSKIFYKETSDWVTLISEFNLSCDSLMISLFAISDSLAYILSAIISSLIADNLGRQKTLILCSSLEIVVRILIYFTKDKYCNLAFVLFMNLFGYINLNTINVYICENINKNRRGFYMLRTNSWACLFGIVIAVIFNKSKNWQYVHLSTIFIVLIGLCLVIVHLRESIKFSFLKKNFLELFETLQIIAKKNDRMNEYLEWKSNFKFFDTDKNIIESQDQNNPLINSKKIYSLKYTLKCIFCDSDNLKIFILFCLIKISVGAAYAYNGIDMRHSSNMLVDPIIFFLSDFIVIVITGELIEIPWIGRKKPVLIFSIIASIFYLVKYFIIIGHSNNYTVFWVDIILRFCININFQILTLWSIESYPFDIAMLASNLNRLASRFGRIYAPIIELKDRNLITAQVAIFIFLSCFLILFLDDTTGKIIDDSTKTMETQKTEITLENYVNPYEDDRFKEDSRLVKKII